MDLRIPLTGRDFVFSRTYTSSQNYTYSGMLGVNWASSTFRFVREIENPSPLLPDLYVGGDARRGTRLYYRGDGRWTASTRSTQYAEEGVVSVRDNEAGTVKQYDAWILVQPGEWRMAFFRDLGTGRTPGTEVIPGWKDGHLLEVRDQYGNAQAFEYMSLNTASNVPKYARPKAVYCWTADSTPVLQAKIEFGWNIGSWYAYAEGKLRTIVVSRPTGDTMNPWRETNSASYVYKPAPNVDEPGYAELEDAHLGLFGDLLEVSVGEIVDGAESASTGDGAWRRQVTQYRYHFGTGRSEFSTDDDGDGFIEQGSWHQLRMRFGPTQIEQAAELMMAADSTLFDIQMAARAFRRLEDGEEVVSGGPIVADFASKVIPRYSLASPYRVKEQQIRAGCGCGSSSSGSPIRFTYDYFSYENSMAFPGSFYAQTTKITESQLVGGVFDEYRTHYYDLKRSANGAAYLINKALVDADSTSHQWVDHYVYDSDWRVVRHMTPAAMSTYTPGTLSSVPAYAASASEGLVRGFAYNSENRPTDTMVRQGAGSSVGDGGIGGADSTFELVTRVTYGDSAQTHEREYLPKEVWQVRTDGASNPSSLGADDIEKMFYTYRFYTTGGDDLAWVRSEVEQDLMSENGPGADEADRYAHYELFDSAGRSVVEVGLDGAVTKYDHQPTTGLVIEEVMNAAWSSGEASPFPDLSSLAPVGSWGRNAEGGALTSITVRDALGRVTGDSTPGEVWRYVRRELRSLPGGSAAEYYSELTFPHKLSGSGLNTDRPVEISYFNAEDDDLGGESRSLTAFTLEIGTVGDFVHPVDAYTLSSTRLMRSETERGVFGEVLYKRKWFDANDDAAFYESQFAYDGLGRLRVEVNANGTARRYTRDVRDRLTAFEVGTLTSGGAGGLRAAMSGNLELVREIEYDHLLPSGATNSSGIGNGNPTKVTDHVAAGDRESVFLYDYRDRLVWTIAPEAPYEFREYDNLDRLSARSLYSTLPSGSTPPSSPSTRGLYETYSYSQRGLSYHRSRPSEPDQSNPSSDPVLEWHSWFDEEGRTVAKWGPNGPAVKRELDGLGRVVKESWTDRGGDDVPGGSSSTSHADALTLTGDIVLEQTEYTYIEDSDGQGDQVGQILVTTLRQRTHDAAITGDLAAASGNDVNDVIATFVGYQYDDADRIVATIDFGTNFSDEELLSGGAAPNASGVATPQAFARIWETAYNERGLVDTQSSARDVGSPAAKILTKHVYDDLNRRVAVIENWTGATVADVTPVPGLEWGRALTLGSNHTSGAASQDRTTISVYDGLNNTIFLVAAHDDGSGSVEYQATEYIYGVAEGTSTPPTSPLTGNAGANGSELHSADLLARVVYPDIEPMESLADHSVIYTYNLVGELIGITDQNGTAHAYVRDDRGRLKQDNATIASGSGIDDWVDRIEIGYDDFGRRATVKSKLASSGAVRNAVRFEYNDLWQITEVRQNPAGDLSGTHEGIVAYSFQLHGVSGGNYSRLRTIGYPEDLPWSGQSSPGTTLKHLYGAKQYEPAGATPSNPTLPFPVNDSISRIDGMTWITLPDDGGTGAVDESELPLVEHRYLGLNDFVYTRYHYPAFRLDRSVDTHMASGGGAAGFDEGVYPGLDRFGRIRRQTWIRDDWSLRAKPAIVDLEYRYDRDSNITHRLDRRAEDRSTRVDRDEVYSYDSIDRLTQSDRGVCAVGSGSLTIGGIANKGRGEQWDLDGVGNWDARRRNITNAVTGGGDPDHAASGNVLDARTFNDANETVDRRVLTLPIDGSDPPAVDFEHDKAGNLVVRRVFDASSGDTVRWEYIYDAWNRLVAVALDPDDEETGSGLQDRARYGYNGLHWRTVRVADSDQDSSLTPDEANLYYYDASWRLLEERVDTDFAASWANEGPGDFSIFRTGGDRVVQRFWRLDYIDALVAQGVSARDGVTGDLSTPTTHYAVTDRLFSVVGLAGESGAILERVRYTPYGEARHEYSSDIDGDGQVNFTELNQNLALFGKTYGDVGYTPDADYDQDGVIDFGDKNPVLAEFGESVPEGAISDPEIGSVVGYAGYIFDPTTGLYLVRFRSYSPKLGRWQQRDPIGYVDGLSGYQYARSSPRMFLDTLGLECCQEDLDRMCNMVDALRNLLQEIQEKSDKYGIVNPTNAVAAGLGLAGAAGSAVASRAAEAGARNIGEACTVRADRLQGMDALDRSLATRKHWRVARFMQRVGGGAGAASGALGGVGTGIAAYQFGQSAYEGDTGGMVSNGCATVLGAASLVPGIQIAAAPASVIAGLGLAGIDAGITAPAQAKDLQAALESFRDIGKHLRDEMKDNPECASKIGECN